MIELIDINSGGIAKLSDGTHWRVAPTDLRIARNWGPWHYNVDHAQARRQPYVALHINEPDVPRRGKCSAILGGFSKIHMNEKPVRLAPKGETLRELFLKSGNLCAYPGCGHLMMNEKGIFVGQVCHIEAAEEGGERFNSAMTNEKRRAATNLMLMCYAHHQETNDVAKFPVNRLQQFKADHEKRFSNPDRAILEKLTDWTAARPPSRPKNLARLSRLLEWNFDVNDLKEPLEELNEYIDILSRVPVELRLFLGAVASRAHRMKDTGAVQSKCLAQEFWRATSKALFNRGAGDC